MQWQINNTGNTCQKVEITGLKHQYNNFSEKVDKC